MSKPVVSGNHGDKIRSDCRVTLEIKKSGGINLDLQSKVASMYGEDIKKQVHEIIAFFDIQHAKIAIEDSGALPFVIAARVEAAIRASTGTDREYLPGLLPGNQDETPRERFRYSRLYLPGNKPSMMINAGIHHPDGIILDLEDSVAPDRKMEARVLVRNALRQVRFYGAERMVRINQLPLGLEDLEMVVPHHVQVILLPKCETKEQVMQVDETICSTLEKEGLTHTVYLMPIIESCLGVENAFELATSSERVIALAVGLEDLTADLGVERTEEGTESLFARMRIVNACKAAGIQPIDSVYSDVDNQEGLNNTVQRSKSLGFEGMGCIHPRQIGPIHRGFAPSAAEIAKAEKIVAAFRQAEEKGLGVVALGSKMIDAPVVKRAHKILEMAGRMPGHG